MNNRKKNYQHNDPRGWVIKTREGKVVEKGFPNYAEAAARIRAMTTEVVKMPEYAMLSARELASHFAAVAA